MFHWVAHTTWMGPGSPSRTARWSATSSLRTRSSWVCTKHTGQSVKTEGESRTPPGALEGREAAGGAGAPSLSLSVAMARVTFSRRDWLSVGYFLKRPRMGSAHPRMSLFRELIPSKCAYFSGLYIHRGLQPVMLATRRPSSLFCATSVPPPARLWSHIRGCVEAASSPTLPQSPPGLPADPNSATSHGLWLPAPSGPPLTLPPELAPEASRPVPAGRSRGTELHTAARRSPSGHVLRCSP